MKSPIIAIILVFLVSCSASKNDSAQSYTSMIPIKSEETLHRYTQNLFLDEQTPQGLGTLLSLNDGAFTKKNISLCTWFLISDSLAMTNSHCIPTKLKDSSELNCGEYLQGAIRGVDESTKVKCQKIIFASNISGIPFNDDDYAIIQLDKKVSAKKFKLNRSGVIEGQKYIIHSMNHYVTDQNIISYYNHYRCLIKSSDLLGLIKSPGISPAVGFQEEDSSLDSCRPVPGNSGSPVVTEEGSLIGVLHGAAKADDLQEMKGAIVSNRVTNNIAIITNLRCQKLYHPLIDQDIPNNCKEELKSVKTDFNKKIEKIKPFITESIEKGLKDQPAFFEYSIDSKSQVGGMKVQFIPKCIKSLKDWFKEDLDQIKREGFLFRRKTIKARIKHYIINVYINIDYYGNLQVDPNFNFDSSVEFFVKSLEKLDEDKKVKIEMIDKEVPFKELPLCEAKSNPEA